MSKSKAHMPKELEKKCQVAIHSAATASAAAGAIPIPMSDAVPITAAQIAMIVALGKVFGVEISQSVAKSIAGVGITQQAGRAVASNLLKMIPGAGTVIGGVIGASTAAALTEALGWIIADDFFRMSKEEEPENIVEEAGRLKSAFKGLRFGEEPENIVEVTDNLKKASEGLQFGKEPKNFVEAADDLKNAFRGLRFPDKK